MTDRASGAVVVVGSLHHDIVVEAPHRPRAGETVTGSRWYPKFGGKGGNQALAAHAAGAQVRLVGAVGDDGFATALIDRLRRAGIDTGRIEETARAGTGMSVALVDAEGDYGAVIVSGANLEIDPARIEAADLWRDAAVLMLQNEVPDAVNLAAAQAARRHGVRVCLNAAPARPLADPLKACLDILVVNALEAEAMGGGRVGDLAAAARAAQGLAQVAPTVVVTAGAAGAALHDKAGVRSRPAAPVRVASTHGAGDVFAGTLCAALALGRPVDTALDAAANAAERHVAGPPAIL